MVTSQRAVEAWGRAGEVVEAEGAVGAGKGKGKARDVEGEFSLPPLMLNLERESSEALPGGEGAHFIARLELTFSLLLLVVQLLQLPPVLPPGPLSPSSR